MPNEILLAVLIVSGIGLLIGVMLAVASIVMAVPVDEKEEAIKEELPGANCGACGFSGCDGYAKALAKGEAEPNLCPVGGAEVAKKIAAVLGVDAGDVEAKVAVVKCLGSVDNTENRFNYVGVNSCKAAVNLVGNLSSCSFGCMGLGDCAKACSYSAVSVCSGVAIVDSQLCKGCGLCAKACPKNIIDIVPKKEHAVVRCSNCDKGAQTRKDCNIGCIGCMKCVKACEAGVLEIKNFCATVEPAKCTACKECVSACPRGCITMFTPL